MTNLPYDFDLLYDIKTVEQLHDHLTGKQRQATSATDRQLIDMMLEFKVPVPAGMEWAQQTSPGTLRVALANTRLEQLHSEMFKIAIAEVEKRARSVLRAGHKGRNPARTFCMAMGAASFYNRHGQALLHGDNVFGKMKWADPFFNFLQEWDETLHLSGYPMKINGPDEPVITDW